MQDSSSPIAKITASGPWYPAELTFLKNGHLLDQNVLGLRPVQAQDLAFKSDNAAMMTEMIKVELNPL